MGSIRQEGYTVVEVTLFLAVSGLLFLVALVGTGTTIRSIRFSDSGRSFTSYLQQQYDLLINGVNTRPSSIACTGGTITSSPQSVGTSSCLLMGKVLVTQENSHQVTSYDIVGSEPAGVDYGQDDEALIQLFQPRVVTLGGGLEYDIPWQAYISGQRRETDNKATNAIALVRSPRSTRIVQYSFKTTEIPLASFQTVVNQAAVNMNKPVALCISSADGWSTVAKVTVGDAPNQSAVKVEFDRASGECDGI